jgi:enoyl-CoA hydratase/carnithine racemase
MPNCATCSASLAYADDVHAVVLSGEGGNFCSGGDVHDIIGPLTKLDMPACWPSPA